VIFYVRRARLDAFQFFSSTSELIQNCPTIQGEISTNSYSLSGIWGGKLSQTATPSNALRCSAAWGGTKSLTLTGAGSRFVLLALLVLAFSLTGFAKTRKIAADLSTVSTGDVDVIVQFKVPPTSDHFNKVQNLGGRLKHDLRGSLRGASFHVP